MDVTCKLTAGFLAGFLRFHVTYYNWQNDEKLCGRGGIKILEIRAKLKLIENHLIIMK